MLKSINNLKKEVAQIKFEKQENVRIQKIQALQKDHEMYELGMNALRKTFGDQRVTEVITKEMSKGPKRVRILSREELKIEINKFKNISLRLMQEMKAQKIKVPGYAAKSNMEPETAMRDLDAPV